jgi:hypothetical protein
MLDFAASLLAELEAWMLQASPAMVDLATFPDISHAFNGPPSVVDDIQKRMYSDEVRTPASLLLMCFLISFFCAAARRFHHKYHCFVNACMAVRGNQLHFSYHDIVLTAKLLRTPIPYFPVCQGLVVTLLPCFPRPCAMLPSYVLDPRSGVPTLFTGAPISLPPSLRVSVSVSQWPSLFPNSLPTSPPPAQARSLSLQQWARAGMSNTVLDE